MTRKTTQLAQELDFVFEAPLGSFYIGPIAESISLKNCFENEIDQSSAEDVWFESSHPLHEQNPFYSRPNVRVSVTRDGNKIYRPKLEFDKASGRVVFQKPPAANLRQNMRFKLAHQSSALSRSVRPSQKSFQALNCSALSTTTTTTRSNAPRDLNLSGAPLLHALLGGIPPQQHDPKKLKPAGSS